MNSVFIATSLDGYIADRNGGLEWLDKIPDPGESDMGYGAFMSRIDALVMGRTTFETVCGFDIEWPFKKPVYVLSTTLTEIPEKFKDKAVLVKGSLTEVLEQIHANGHYRLYIDGGKTVQSFLKEDLIDDMVITMIPALLGGGYPLFGELRDEMWFECVKTETFPNNIAQHHYVRKRD
ncbi:MAG: dihydrofolate reductase family protein [Flavobacteriales bacterium]